MSAIAQLVSALTRWPVESQQRARRNAMIASTALAHRRAEIDDVEEFLASLGQDTRQDTGHDTGSDTADTAGRTALG